MPLVFCKLLVLVDKETYFEKHHYRKYFYQEITKSFVRGSTIFTSSTFYSAFVANIFMFLSKTNFLKPIQ